MSLLAVDRSLINGTPYSGTSCDYKLDFVPYTGILSADWEEKRETKLVRDASADGVPVGQTSGIYSVDGFTMKMLRASASAFKQQLALKGLGSYGDPEWTFYLSVFEPTLTGLSSPITYTGSRCRVTSWKESHEVGVDELVTEIGITCIQFTQDGLGLYSLIRSI